MTDAPPHPPIIAKKKPRPIRNLQAQPERILPGSSPMARPALVGKPAKPQIIDADKPEP